MTFDSVDKRWNKLWHPNVIHSPLNTLITKNTNKYLLGWERHGSPCPGGCVKSTVITNIMNDIRCQIYSFIPEIYSR